VQGLAVCSKVMVKVGNAVAQYNEHGSDHGHQWAGEQPEADSDECCGYEVVSGVHYTFT
jgi:hypothetical protein